jgi:hypothetical protein
MKIKSLILSSAFVFTFGLTQVVALQSQPPGLNFPTPLLEGNSVTGPITNIDPVNQVIQVRDDIGIIRSFRADQNIDIMRNGAPVQFSDLNLGDLVTITKK